MNVAAAAERTMAALDERLRPVLLPYQARMWRDRRQVVITEKARRTGGSWTLAGKAAEHAANDLGNVWYQSYDLDMTEMWIEKCAAWARRLHRAQIVAASLRKRRQTDHGVVIPLTLPDGSEIRATKFTIRFGNGRRVEALSSAARALRSKGDPGDLLIFDEAAFVGPGLSPEKREAHWNAVLQAMMAIPLWGGRIEMISTHNGDMSGFNQLVEATKRGETGYGLRRVDLDRAIRDGLARVIYEERSRLDPEGDWVYRGEESDVAFRASAYAPYRALPAEAAAEELGCIPQASMGRYFERWLVDACMAPAPIRAWRADARKAEGARHAALRAWLRREVGPLLERLDPDDQHVFGFDFGRERNPSVLAVVALGRPMATRFLVEMRGTPHSDQQMAIKWIASKLPRFRGGRLDATGIGDAVAEAVAEKFGNVHKEKLTRTWWSEEAPRYKGLLEDRAIRIPRSDDVMADHRAVERMGGVPGLPDGSSDRHGDSVVALMLACQQARQPGAAVSSFRMPQSPANAVVLRATNRFLAGKRRAFQRFYRRAA